MTNFVRALSHQVMVDGRRRAVSDPRRSLSYAELWRYAGRICTVLEGHGVVRGSRVASVCHNSIEALALDIAVKRMGAVYAPMNYRLAEREQDHLVALVDPAVVVADEVGPGRPGRWLRTDDLRVDITPADRWSGVHAYEPAAPSDVATILFTSGTTGSPKGAALTHANLWASCANVAHHFALTPRDVTAIYLPLFHTAGLHLQAMPLLYAGGEVVVHDGWNRSEFTESLLRHPVSYAFVSPQQWGEITADLAGVRLDFPKPVTGGAYVTDDVLDGVEELCGSPPHFIMGMTEASPLLFHVPARELRRRRPSIGRPSTYADIEVRPFDSAPHGEICIRGQLVMKGYWNNPAADAAAFDPAGFFHGGDVAHQDADGFVYLMDRLKDMIRSGGENIFSVEVEAVLAEHPDVDQVAVIGVPHQRWDEAVCAVVVPAPGARPTLEELQRHCRGRIAGFKKPLLLELRDTLPRSATDKVAKRQLREEIVTRRTEPIR